MTAAAPQVGDFIRPVGPFGYCLQAVKLTTYSTGKQITYRRWGLVDGQPFDDGHCLTGYFLNNLLPAGAGVWKEPASGCSRTMYYRKIAIHQPATGQQQLFN